MMSEEICDKKSMQSQQSEKSEPVCDTKSVKSVKAVVRFGSTDVIEISVTGNLRRCRSRSHRVATSKYAHCGELQCCADTPLDKLGENWQPAQPWKPPTVPSSPCMSEQSKKSECFEEQRGDARLCEDCDMWVVGAVLWDEHLRGRKHKKNIKEKNAVKAVK